MTNFKQETLALIGDHKIDEYMFKFSRDWHLFTITSYKGKEGIALDEILAIMRMYDNGYGLRHWKGWITFKDTSDWLERKEDDATQWWVWRSRPSLEKERKN